MNNVSNRTSIGQKTLKLFLLISVFLTLTSLYYQDAEQISINVLDKYPITAEIIALRDRIDEILTDYDSFEYDFGLKIVSMEIPQTFYELQSDKPLSPASNLKIITTAAAFDMLGSDFRWVTEFHINDSNNLYIRSSGDPTWNDSYRKGMINRVTKSIADSLKKHGFTSINNIIVHPGAFNNAPIGLGWRLENRLHSFSAKSSAIAFNDNAVQVRIAPATVGNNARITLYPVNAGFRVVNNVRTTANRNSQGINFSADHDRNTITVMGNIWVNSRAQYRTIAVPRPDLYSLEILKHKLREHGITVRGNSLYQELSARTLSIEKYSNYFPIVSPPLYEVTEEINKRSNNFVSNQLFITIADKNENNLDSEKLIKQWLNTHKVSADSLLMYDGSGLSYLNKTTADILVDVLKIMGETSYFEEYKNTMAICGVDGTLRLAFQDERLHRKVYAKTGFISGVRGLTGYVYTKDNEILAFSFLVNKEGSRINNFNNIIGRILVELVEFTRNDLQANYLQERI